MSVSVSSWCVLTPLALLATACAEPARRPASAPAPAVRSGLTVRLETPDQLVQDRPMACAVRVSCTAGEPLDVAAVTLPDVPGTIARDGASTEYVDGAAHTLRIPLALTPHTRGLATIPPITVRLGDGTVLRTAPTMVAVGDGDARLVGEIVCTAAFTPSAITAGGTTTLVYRVHLRHALAEGTAVAPPAGCTVAGEQSVVEDRSYDLAGEPWTRITVTWPLRVAAAGTYTAAGNQPYRVEVAGTVTARGTAAVAPATLTVAAAGEGAAR